MPNAARESPVVAGVFLDVKNELDDLFVIHKGLEVNDKIVLEWIRQVRDGEKVEFEEHKPEQVVANLKYHAE